MFKRTITLYEFTCFTTYYNNVRKGSLKRTREDAEEAQRIYLRQILELEERESGYTRTENVSLVKGPISHDAKLGEILTRLNSLGVGVDLSINEYTIDVLPEERGLLPQYLTQAEMDLVDNMYVYNEVPEEEKNEQIYEICNILTLKQMDAIGIVRTGSAGINKRYTTETSDVRDMLYLAFLSLVNAYIQVKLREPNVEN